MISGTDMEALGIEIRLNIPSVHCRLVLERPEEMRREEGVDREPFGVTTE